MTHSEHRDIDPRPAGAGTEFVRLQVGLTGTGLTGTGLTGTGLTGAEVLASGLTAAEIAAVLHQTLSTNRRRRLAVAVLALALVVVGGAVVAAVSSVASTVGLTWSTGVTLAVLLGLTWTLCAHAGGHAWLVPVPAGVLALLWLSAVGSGDGSLATVWWLAGASAALVALATVMAAVALQLPGSRAGSTGSSLHGAEGVAVTALDPVGVARVAGESWTAESVSGPLPAGAPLHVIRTQGLRLLVWSEQGTVPGPDALGTKEVSP